MCFLHHIIAWRHSSNANIGMVDNRIYITSWFQRGNNDIPKQVHGHTRHPMIDDNQQTVCGQVCRDLRLNCCSKPVPKHTQPTINIVARLLRGIPETLHHFCRTLTNSGRNTVELLCMVTNEYVRRLAKITCVVLSWNTRFRLCIKFRKPIARGDEE